jgi:hypothetical protein
MKRPVFRLAATGAALLLLPLLGACDGVEDPGPLPSQSALVVNSIDNSLTVIPVDGNGLDARTIGLGAVSASPVSVAARNGLAVVPEGIYPFAAVVSLGTGSVTSVALPANSGATGVAFLNDSIALVGNSNLNTVSPVNVLRHTVGTAITVGTYPQALVRGEDGRVYVLNGNLVNFSPAGPGSVSVLNTSGQVTATIALTGINPSAGVVRGNRLYVLNSGHFGQGDGSLSVVNLATGHEDRLVTGFGEFPGAVDVGPDGLVYVAVYGTGIVVWNPGSLAFGRPLGNPLVPGGAPPVAGIGFDRDGKLHTVNPGDCRVAGRELRLAGETVERSAATGICPFALAFTE